MGLKYTFRIVVSLLIFIYCTGLEDGKASEIGDSSIAVLSCKKDGLGQPSLYVRDFTDSNRRPLLAKVEKRLGALTVFKAKLPAGHYNVGATGRLCSSSAPIIVLPGAPRNLSLVLFDGLGDMYDFHRGLAGTLPFRGVKVRLFKGNVFIATAREDGFGYYFEHLPRGVFEIRYSTSDGHEFKKSVDLSSNDIFQWVIVNLTLEDLVTLR